MVLSNYPEKMEFLYEIKDIYRTIQTFENQLRNKYSLSFNEILFLHYLGYEEKLSCKEMKKLLNIKSSNISKLTKTIENKMIITRMSDSNDKRLKYYTLTKKGRKLLMLIRNEYQNCPYFIL